MATRPKVEEPTLQGYAHQCVLLFAVIKEHTTGPDSKEPVEIRRRIASIASIDVHWCSLMRAVVL